MFRNITLIINRSNSNRLGLEPIFVGRNLYLALRPALNTYYSFNWSSERTLTSRHCNCPLQHYCHHLAPFTNNLVRVNYSSFLRVCQPNLNIQELQKRQKTKNPQKRPEYDSDSDSDEDDDELSKASKPATLRVQSLRLDGLLKKAFNVARNKVETAFYEGNIRVNGSKPIKKSLQVKLGDEVDLIKGVSPMNPDFLSVSRVEILSVKEDPDEKEEKVLVKIRRTKTLYVENYTTDPWKKSSSAD